MFIYVCRRKQKQRIMKHRQFKTECICAVTINGKRHTCNELRGVKKEIYAQGTRGEKYKVNVIDKKTAEINDVYLMKYTKEGPIFQKQIYSRLRLKKNKARANSRAFL